MTTTAAVGRLHAFELTFDDESDAAVRAAWAALADAGLPSLASHTGRTHRPHLTVLSAPSLNPEQCPEQVQALAALLPASVPVVGTLLLPPAGQRPRPSAAGSVNPQPSPAGSINPRPSAAGRTVLAYALTPDEAMQLAVAALRLTVPARHPTPWLSHVTVAKRLAAEQVAPALAALPDPPSLLLAVGLRWWNPQVGTVTELS